MAITDLVPWRWGEKKVPVRRDEEYPFYPPQISPDSSKSQKDCC